MIRCTESTLPRGMLAGLAMVRQAGGHVTNLLVSAGKQMREIWA